MAVTAADSTTPAQTRNDLILALRPLIEQAALVTARAMNADPGLRQDLCDQSLTHIVEQLGKFDPQRGSFQGWCRMVLHSLGASLRRSRTRRAEVSIPSDQLESQPDRDCSSDEEAIEQLGACFLGLRAVLDARAWPPSRRIDYFAVLLLQLRLELADLYRATCGVRPAGEVVERVVDWLPWHNHEELRRCQAGLPTLAELWAALAPRLGERLGGLQEVVEIVNEMAVGAHLTRNALAQWMFRARQEAMQRFGDDWDAAGFSRLLCRGGSTS